MTRSLRTPGHQALMQVLVETRKSKGVTQQELADRLDRPQSYVAKIETGERRLDVVEFVEWAVVLEAPVGQVLQSVSEAVKGLRPAS
ncbi:helix-turn-helix domain-containing protein [Tateyamaria omphalii]|nr:helix-turn-helix domain-containing protein [Tateyamaria omphalii]